MTHASAAPAHGDRPSMARLRAFLPLIADLVVPTAGYFLLSALGVPDVWALTGAGLATGLHTALGVVRRRKLDGVALLVAVELLLSAALLLVSDDPRVLLLKPSFYTLVAAGYLAVSLVVGRPVVYQAATPLATDGRPERAAAYHAVWDASPEFRRRQRLVCAAFAVALAVEAVLRVVVVLSLPASEVGTSLLAGQVPGVVLIVAALVFTRSQVPAISRLVDEQEARMRTAPPSPLP